MATKKAAAKKTARKSATKKVAKKSTAKKSTAKKSLQKKKTAAKKTARKSATKKVAKKSTAKKSTAKKSLQKKKTAAKKTKKIDHVYDVTEELEMLMKRGKQRGFVTEDEIMHAVPDIENDVAELEAFYDALEGYGIAIVHSDDILQVDTEEGDIARGRAQSKRIQQQKDVLLVEEAAANEGNTADLVQMYLKEIGRVPLLTTEEEVAVAKAVANGDEAARQRLTESNLRLVVSIAKNMLDDLQIYRF